MLSDGILVIEHIAPHPRVFREYGIKGLADRAGDDLDGWTADVTLEMLGKDNRCHHRSLS
jgi:hypothetical protein